MAEIHLKPWGSSPKGRLSLALTPLSSKTLLQKTAGFQSNHSSNTGAGRKDSEFL